MTIYMGNVVNPLYQKTQSIPMKLTYNTNSPSSASQTISISSNTFLADTISSASLDQTSALVLESNMYTITFKPKLLIKQNSKIIIMLPREISISTTTAFTVEAKIGDAAQGVQAF